MHYRLRKLRWTLFSDTQRRWLHYVVEDISIFKVLRNNCAPVVLSKMRGCELPVEEIQVAWRSQEDLPGAAVCCGFVRSLQCWFTPLSRESRQITKSFCDWRRSSVPSNLNTAVTIASKPYTSRGLLDLCWAFRWIRNSLKLWYRKSIIKQRATTYDRKTHVVGSYFAINSLTKSIHIKNLMLHSSLPLLHQKLQIMSTT